MIDSQASRAIETIEARTTDLYRAYTPGFIPVDSTTRVASGTLRADMGKSELDVVAPVGTYFIGQDPLGRRFFSRNGVFNLTGGELRTQNGSAVLGYPASGTACGLVSLRADPIDVAAGRCFDPRIEADGTVVYSRRVVDPKSGAGRPERVVLGRVALARFPAGSDLAAADGVHVTAPSGVEPRIGPPGSAGLGELALRRIDRGAYDVKAGLAELREAYVNFDALRSAINSQHKDQKTVMDMIK